MRTTIAGIKSKFKIHHNRNQSDSRLAENWPKKFSMYVKQRLRMETMAAIDTATDSKRKNVHRAEKQSALLFRQECIACSQCNFERYRTLAFLRVHRPSCSRHINYKTHVRKHPLHIVGDVNVGASCGKSLQPCQNNDVEPGYLGIP